MSENKLIMKNTHKTDGRIERNYYINSSCNSNRIGSSNRINNYDSEEKTLSYFVEKGLTAKQIRAFSQPVERGDKKIQPRSSYFKKEKKSGIKLELSRKGEYIQSIFLGSFPDKYCGFFQAHKIATQILDQNLSEIKVRSKNGEEITRAIKPIFYNDEPLLVFKDDEIELQKLLDETINENYQLSLENTKLKKENHNLKTRNKDQEILLEAYHQEHVWRELITCPDCGAERYRLYSSKTNKYFVGCSSGEHHTIRDYDKLAHLCYKEGLLRDVWVENNEGFMYPDIKEEVR